jgi:hypothetical protein
MTALQSVRPVVGLKFGIAFGFERAKTGEWWALVDDLRTLPPGQILAAIPHEYQCRLNGS